MAVKWIGPMNEVNGEMVAQHAYPHIPTRDLDDDELRELAKSQETRRDALERMLTRDLPKVGPLYQVVEQDKPARRADEPKAEEVNDGNRT